jgi:ArsR family transcriptional regulator
MRIRLILAIGEREVCVCHLEAALGARQAAISQHLMHLRKAGLVISTRSGRHIYYRLAHPEWLDFIRSAASLAGESAWVEKSLSHDPVPGCPCPECCTTPICPRHQEPA